MSILADQLTIAHEIARRTAEIGMSRALDRANAEHRAPLWSELALSYLERYARSHERFTGWMVVRSADLSPDFPSPQNGKAWGSVMREGARRGWIERVGTARDPHRHGNPIPLWRSRIHGDHGA
jgi:hypothetical protein